MNDTSAESHAFREKVWRIIFRSDTQAEAVSEGYRF
jgi:hypothetical protein